MTVISMAAVKEKRVQRQYIAYYGTPVKVARVQRSAILAIEEYTEDDIAQLQGSIDMSSYMEWLEQLEDIDIDNIDIVQWNNSIPW